MPTIGIPKSGEEVEDPGLNTTPFSDSEMWEYHCKRIRAYLDCPSWKCPECGCVNFGRNKYCPYCKDRLKKITNRPPGTGVEEKWKRMGNL